MFSLSRASVLARSNAASAASAISARGIAGEPAAPAMKTAVPGPESKKLMTDLDKVIKA